MFCTKCGAEQPDNAKFCQFCGTPFEQQGASSIDLNKKQDSCESPLGNSGGETAYDKDASPYSSAQYQQNAQNQQQNAQDWQNARQYQQQQYAQYQQYYQYAQNQQYGSLEQLNTYLIPNILITVLCFGNILSIIGIIFGCMAMNAKNKGNLCAFEYARYSKNLFWWALGLGILSFVLFLFFFGLGVIGSTLGA